MVQGFFLGFLPVKCYSEDMGKMPRHTRLYRRGAMYYHRAAILVDIRDTYPKSEETFSLRTKDYDESLKCVRVAAVEVDEKFDAHRRQRMVQSLPARQVLSVDEIKMVGEVYFYYAHLLEEGENTRYAGFYEGERLAAPAKSFEEHVDDIDVFEASDRYHLARGKVDPHYLDEAEEVLSWSNVNIHLDPQSHSMTEWQANSRRRPSVLPRP